MILTTDTENIETHGKSGYTRTRRKFYLTRPDPRVTGGVEFTRGYG